jgi:hypothetical protein
MINIAMKILEVILRFIHVLAALAIHFGVVEEPIYPSVDLCLGDGYSFVGSTCPVMVYSA